jgi:hypothetical protein
VFDLDFAQVMAPGDLGERGDDGKIKAAVRGLGGGFV